jgi:TetR/AcrR family transcriptional repressor of nem operon
MFRQSGFNGCSVQDITDAAGVPKGSFYNHYDSKEALGAAAIDHYWSDGACIRLEILSDPSKTPLERLRFYFDQAAHDLADLDFTCGCLIGNMAAELSDHSTVIAAELSKIFTSWSGKVAGCIREAQDAGEISAKADADMLATFVLNAWEGAVLRARIEKGNRPLRQFIDTLFSQLLR